MAMTNPAQRWTQPKPVSPVGPVVTFGATVVLTLILLAIAPTLLPRDFVMPVISSAFFLFAAMVALAAWRFGQPHQEVLSYWDVAGALTLFGIFSGILIEPEQFVRLIESQQDGRR
jgi:hypothetical protein